MPAYYEKDPDARKDYTIDWSSFLGADTITNSTWTVSTGLTSDTPSNNATTATIWLSGGTARQWYTAANRITTAAGRIEDRTLHIWCLEQ